MKAFDKVLFKNKTVKVRGGYAAFSLTTACL